MLQCLGDLFATLASSNSCCFVRCGLLVVVALGLLKSLSVLSGFLNTLSYLFANSNPRKFGQWAIVTGGNDGIGLAYATRLAKLGMNVIITGRKAESLEKAQQKIQQAAPKAEVRMIQADFSFETSAAAFAAIEEGVRGLDVGVLVNNAGVSYKHAEFLNLITDKEIQELIAVNVTATTAVTRIVLPGMIERKRGAIVNVGSAAGTAPTGNPLYAVYSGTKAYVEKFTRSLHHEMKSKGILVQSHVPYYVSTKMSRMRPSISTPTPATYARAAVKCLGLTSWPSVVPYWEHALEDWVGNSVPSGLLAKFLVHVHLGIRKRAYKKKEREAKAAAE